MKSKKKSGSSVFMYFCHLSQVKWHNVHFTEMQKQPMPLVDSQRQSGDIFLIIPFSHHAVQGTLGSGL